MGVFKDYAYYYNIFYQEKDYKTEAIQVSRILKKYGNNVLSIINYGCGTGKHDIEMVKLGYQCDSIDISSEMIEIARKNANRENLEINYSVADIRDYNPKKKYDAVVSLFHVMSYQNTNEDIVKAFCSAKKALNTNGVLLFDVWYGPGVLSDKPSIRVKEVEDNENRLIRIARPVMHDKTNSVDVCYEIFSIDKKTGKIVEIYETHHMRYFFRPELEEFLTKTGFKLIDNLDCQTLDATDFDSWTSYFIAKAL